jgi:hypothetical protein
LIYHFPFGVELAPDDLQLKLTDLQSDNGLKEKFSSMKGANFVGLLRDSKYRNLKKDFGNKMLSIFIFT